TLADVTLVHHGLVPAVLHADGSASLQKHEQVKDHASEGVEGLVTVAGTKYTTARAVAERVTGRLFTKLGRAAVPCRTAATPLPGGGLRDVMFAVAEARSEHDPSLPSDTIPHLVVAYGSRYRDVAELAHKRADWRVRLAPQS